jgi:hypothetical protein
MQTGMQPPRLLYETTSLYKTRGGSPSVQGLNLVPSFYGPPLDYGRRTTHSTYPPPIATIAKHVLEGLTGQRGLAYSRDTSSAQW